MKKIPSYSIIELIVVMLISTLVISFSYTALEFTTERNHAFEEKQEKLFDYESLVNQLQKDLINASSVLKSGDQLLIHLSDSTTRTYAFGDSTTLTIQQEIISFKVKTTIPEYYFLNEIQHLDKGLIDRLSLSFTVHQEPLRVDFIKTYGADVLLNYNYERD